MKEHMQKIKSSIKKNFSYATPNFLFIILFVNVFQKIFGMENSIVGVIFTIMMSASMVRDMTAAPFKHLINQAVVLVWMGISAYLVSALNPFAALPINLLTIFIILYAFTFEYANHMYFPYILSYLFLVFISPVPLSGLPKRLAGLLAGAVCIILYQLFKGQKRVVETARDVLTEMIDEARSSIAYSLTGEGCPADPGKIRHSLCKLSRTVYERRKRVLCVSDASFSMIDSGRGLEHILTLIHDLELPLTEEKKKLLERVDQCLAQYRSFVHQESSSVELPVWEGIPSGSGGFKISCQNSADSSKIEFYNALVYVGNHLIHMTDKEKRAHYRRTALSLSVRLKAALDVSYVRVVYALRTAVLLSVFTLIVQGFALPHGKWLMFTLASLSLPYADDVGAKTRKRIAATILGGLIAVAVYALIPSMLGRSLIMMLSGYASFYFSDYTGTYACSTIGALGGAVITSSFGWGGVGRMFFIRICYIIAGAVIAVVVNCYIFPFSREKATKLLLAKYAATTNLLTRVCESGDADEVDAQLYYNLVIQAHLQEDKLAENAAQAGWEEMRELLAQCRGRVRRAHRHHKSFHEVLLEKTI